MIKITLKDGSVKELAAPQSIADFTKDLSMGCTAMPAAP